MRAAGVWLVAAVLLVRGCSSNLDSAHAALPTAGILDVAEQKVVVALSLDAARDDEYAGAERGGGRDGMRRVVIADHAGTRFSCQLPEAQAAAGGDSGDGVATDADEAHGERTVSALMEQISNACFYRVEGWWTFELCVRKHVRQFHQEKDAVVSEYVLGVFDEAATAQRHADAAQPFQEEPSATGAATRFHAHVFANGTACDLTGRPRSTEVRFVCAPDTGAPQPPVGGALAAHFIESIKEPTTCHYVLTLATPLLCAHAAFRVEEAPVALVRCRALPPGDAAAAAGNAGAAIAADDAVPQAQHAAAGARDEL